MKIHNEGKIIILLSAIVLSVICSQLTIYAPNWLNIPFTILSLIFFGLVLYFFRDPKVTVEQNESSVLSPADGKIVVIEKVLEDEYLNQECWQLSIFMSPLNVHVNRIPIVGTVRYVKYHKGHYYVAWHPKASHENERTTIAITNKNVSLMMRQIAGAVARRICCYVAEGDRVVQGEQMGFIKFGSRVDIFLPTTINLNIQVKLNQKVKAGITNLATLDIKS